jgi:spermidine synthase
MFPKDMFSKEAFLDIRRILKPDGVAAIVN